MSLELLTQERQAGTGDHHCLLHFQRALHRYSARVLFLSTTFTFSVQETCLHTLVVSFSSYQLAPLEWPGPAKFWLRKMCAAYPGSHEVIKGQFSDDVRTLFCLSSLVLSALSSESNTECTCFEPLYSITKLTIGGRVSLPQTMPTARTTARQQWPRRKWLLWKHLQ